MSIQGWFPLGWTGWISLQSKGLSRIFSNTTVQKHQFFRTQPSLWSNSHIHTWPLGKPELSLYGPWSVSLSTVQQTGNSLVLSTGVPKCTRRLSRFTKKIPKPVIPRVEVWITTDLYYHWKNLMQTTGNRLLLKEFLKLYALSLFALLQDTKKDKKYILIYSSSWRFIIEKEEITFLDLHTSWQWRIICKQAGSEWKQLFQC